MNLQHSIHKTATRRPQHCSKIDCSDVIPSCNQLKVAAGLSGLQVSWEAPCLTRGLMQAAERQPSLKPMKVSSRWNITVVSQTDEVAWGLVIPPQSRETSLAQKERRCIL